MPAPETIVQLIRRFEDNLPAYCSGSYNEAQLRLEFLNPFFEALGWDVANREIDRLVYELYGLTDEEIRIVEGGKLRD